MTKTSAKAAALMSVAAMLLVGCGTSDGKPASAESTGGASATVSITHAWGTDDYPVKPETVVALGTSVDNLLALGITPTAVIETPYDKDAPWRTKELEGVERIDVASFATVPTEKIAALKPDIIVGDFWGITEDNYQALKKIAPTLGGIGNQGEALGWKAQIKELGKVFDKSAEAERVIAEDAALFESAKRDMPQLAGASGVLAQYIKSRGIGVVVDPKEPGNSFFYDLGMRVPDAVTQLPQRSGRAIVSAENIATLEADFMLIYPHEGTAQDMKSTPGYGELRQVKSGATVVGDMTLVQAINDPSARSRAWALDQLRTALSSVTPGS